MASEQISAIATLLLLSTPSLHLAFLLATCSRPFRPSHSQTTSPWSRVCIRKVMELLEIHLGIPVLKRSSTTQIRIGQCSQSGGRLSRSGSQLNIRAYGLLYTCGQVLKHIFRTSNLHTSTSSITQRLYPAKWTESSTGLICPVTRMRQLNHLANEDHNSSLHTYPTLTPWVTWLGQTQQISVLPSP